MGTRGAAGLADDPNLRLLAKSLQISEKLMHMVLIGALLSVSIHSNNTIGFLSPITIFTALSTVIYLVGIIFDEVVLGEAFDSLIEMVEDTTGDSPFEKWLNDQFTFILTTFQDILHGDSNPKLEDSSRSLWVVVILSPLFVLVSFPVWWVVSAFTGGYAAAIMIVFSLFFLRDTGRYLSYTYGGATTFNQLTLRLRWEVLWTICMGGLIAGTLGYDLTAILDL